MSKYDALTEWLRRQLGNRIVVPFEDIEDQDKIGVQLPRTAKENRDWWANENNRAAGYHHQSRAWMKAGWKPEHVDLGRQFVTFVRIRMK
jgi:hypothetical protein